MTSKAFRENYKLIEWNIKPSEPKRTERKKRGFYVIPDIDPYRSMITGERIAGRRQHRDHLRQHEVVEVGNEKLPAFQRKELPNVRDDIRAAQAMVSEGYRPRPPDTYEG